MSEYSSTQYLLDDLPRTLFPMGTTPYLVERGADDLFEYIYKRIFAPADAGAFASHARCFAVRSDFHLRRTSRGKTL